MARPLVLVTWLDHVSLDDWTDADEVKNTPLAVINTVGWVYHETEQALWVVSTSGVDGQSGTLMVIVKSAIVSRKVLRDANKTKRGPKPAKLAKGSSPTEVGGSVVDSGANPSQAGTA